MDSGRRHPLIQRITPLPPKVRIKVIKAKVKDPSIHVSRTVHVKANRVIQMPIEFKDEWKLTTPRKSEDDGKIR